MTLTRPACGPRPVSKGRAPAREIKKVLIQSKDQEPEKETQSSEPPDAAGATHPDCNRETKLAPLCRRRRGGSCNSDPALWAKAVRGSNEDLCRSAT